ncbi:unnamed protein product [Camellia sinensis]
MSPGHLIITEWRAVILRGDWREVQFYGIKARDWPSRPASRKIESGHLHQRPELGPKHAVRAKQWPSQPASKVTSKEERSSATVGSVGSWVPGVPDWFVMQNKPREVFTERVCLIGGIRRRDYPLFGL